MKEQSKIVFDNEFYKRLAIDDIKLLSNIEHGIELYIGKHDKKGHSDAAINFERALGIFSISYVRLSQEIFKLKQSEFSPDQKLFLNFGVLDPRIFKRDDLVQELYSEILTPVKSNLYDMYYLDEWIIRISRGLISLTSDVGQTKSKSKDQELQDIRIEKRKKLEVELENFCKSEIDRYTELKGFYRLFSPETAQGEKLKILTAIRKKIGDIERIVKEENIRIAEIDSLTSKEASSNDSDSEDRKSEKIKNIREEFELLVTVMRSCAARGRLIKNTPILIDKWLPMESSSISVNTFSCVEKRFSEIENIDSTIFKDKNGNRKAPKILILPGVGTGMSWKDRIMLSLFDPPTSQGNINTIKTLGGYRWYLATQSFNWKSLPGELGSMYQLIYPDLTFTNLEKSFIDDYVTWIKKESQGYQVLPSNVRKLFWKMIPFTSEHKLKLSKRAPIYGKLYSEDLIKGEQ
mgnify:CR=1 FL=1